MGGGGGGGVKEGSGIRLQVAISELGPRLGPEFLRAISPKPYLTPKVHVPHWHWYILGPESPYMRGT